MINNTRNFIFNEIASQFEQDSIQVLASRAKTDDTYSALLLSIFAERIPHFDDREKHAPLIAKALVILPPKKLGSREAKAFLAFLGQTQYFNKKEILNPLLIDAVICGNDTMVLELLNRGASIETKRATMTPLHYACSRGEKEVVRLLLDRGASMEAKASDFTKSTPLMLLLQRKDNPEILSLFLNKIALDHPVRVQALHWAVNFGKIKSVALLLDAGVSIIAQNDQGETPLHTAARLGRKEIVTFLLGKGAPIDARDHKRRTPLHLCSNRSIKLIQIYL
jgi:Ankyrin repeats (3 copies)